MRNIIKYFIDLIFIGEKELEQEYIGSQIEIFGDRKDLVFNGRTIRNLYAFQLFTNLFSKSKNVLFFFF
jgi:hypothetical protein